MIKGAIDCTDILFQALKGSAFETALTGDVYPNERPDSELEDAVINTINVDASWIQQARSNVNIYVPNLRSPVAGKLFERPNRVRLKQLSDMAVSVLENRTTQQYRYHISGISDPIAEADKHQHYINLRVDYQFFPS